MKPNEEIIIPIVPLRDGVVYPQTEIVLTFGRKRSINSLESAFGSNKLLGLVMQKSSKLEDPQPQDLFYTGTLCQIDRMLKGEGEINVLVKGIHKFEILSFESLEPILMAKVRIIEDKKIIGEEITAFCNHLATDYKKAVNLGKSVDFMVFMNIMSEISPSEMANQISSTLNIKPEEKQYLLEEQDLIQKLRKIAEHLSKEVKILEIERSIATKTQEKFDKNIKEQVLRERIKTIEKELGESGEDQEIRDFREKIKKSEMPFEIAKKAEKELKKLKQMSPYNPEASYVKNYLDWLTEMPWKSAIQNKIDTRKSAKILDKDHYGLEKIKERILEYLAVLKLKQERNLKENKEKNNSSIPTILCFVGPPGVGKTSIGKSIAKALGRKFIKVSLGGIRDEAEIRGHRRTYVGAMPGRIIQGIKDAGSNNPVFMLDEIDKVGTDFRGDPSSALLEALDPEQNHAFSDHYLEVDYDLSGVIFITTCNVLDTIPPALRDRLEVIHFSGYTAEEKIRIGLDHLWNKQINAHGLTDNQIKVSESAMTYIIQRYTREAGVRNLERKIATICRKVAREIAEKQKRRNMVTNSTLSKYLGPEIFSKTLAEKKNEVGMSTGLAWTEAGGEILFIEVALMPGKGNLIITGQIGNVMKESAQAALSYIRSKYDALKLPKDFYQKIDIHIHVPEGAVPKDGPSAGCAITSALVSALTKKPTYKDKAMTGEITLRGRVLEIGGVKEKIIAAKRAGIKTVILPRDNKKDLVEIPKNVKNELKFVFADNIEEVLKEVIASK